MPHHISRRDLDHYQPVEGIVVGILSGEDHGLGDVSVVESESQPGASPPEHRHPYVEIFVVQEGRGRYMVDGREYDAAPGDVIIVPSDTIHGFTNIGDGVLRQVAIHQTPRTAFLEEWRIPPPE